MESLGVETSEATHMAFDRMADEQSGAIETLSKCISLGRVNDLRNAAAKEAQELVQMFNTLAEK